MVNFSELAIPFIIFLISINTMFLAMGTLPGSQFDDGRTLFSDITTNDSMMDSMGSYVTDANGNMLNMYNSVDINGNPIVTTTAPDITTILFNIANSATGGALGYVSQFIGMLLQLAFGYAIWIDYFLNPAWHPFFYYVGFIVKGLIGIIQLYAIISIFTALVGRRIG